MRRMIAASVARRIALKKMGAGALALAAVADAGQLNPDSPRRIAGAGGGRCPFVVPAQDAKVAAGGLAGGRPGQRGAGCTAAADVRREDVTRRG